METTDIVYAEEVHFEFPEENIVIIYNEGVWKARYNSEFLIDDDMILEDRNNGIEMDEDFVIGPNFTVTREQFQEFKKIVGDKQ